MKTFRLWLMAFAVVSSTSFAAAPSLLALSKRDHTMAIVDPVSLKVLAKLPVGDDPHEVIASEDGRVAYVSNYGGGAFHSLAVLNLVTQKAEASIDLGALLGPHGLFAQGGKIWFTAEASKAIGHYDPATSKIDWIFGTGQDRTHMLHVSPDGLHIVTTNVSSGTVSLIGKAPPHEGPGPGGPGGPPPGAGPGGSGGPPPGPHGPPGGDWQQTVVKVGAGPEGFDVTADGKQAWVANGRDGTISIIDLSTGQVTQTIAAEVQSANRLKLTPDGKLALVSALRGKDLTVLDVATRKVVKRIPIGQGAAGILVQPDGKRSFVACTPDNDVAVIDLAKLAVTGKVIVGDEPDGLAWATAPR